MAASPYRLHDRVQAVERGHVAVEERLRILDERIDSISARHGRTVELMGDLASTVDSLDASLDASRESIGALSRDGAERDQGPPPTGDAVAAALATSRAEWNCTLADVVRSVQQQILRHAAAAEQTAEALMAREADAWMDQACKRARAERRAELEAVLGDYHRRTAAELARANETALQRVAAVEERVDALAGEMGTVMADMQQRLARLESAQRGAPGSPARGSPGASPHRR